MDCPYYEQLQYAGDTRIQALVSLYTTGDGRLMRNAIEQLNDSRTAEGATDARAPSVAQQYIPPFSLWWIGMVHDYYRYVDDPAFVREMLNGVRAVLGFYESTSWARTARLGRDAMVERRRLGLGMAGAGARRRSAGDAGNHPFAVSARPRMGRRTGKRAR